MNVKVKQMPMTKDIIDRIIEIDKEFYLDFDYNDTSWYFKRYSEKNSVTVLEVDGQIVGYYCFYNISENLLQDICDLKYSGDYSFDESEVNVASDIEYIPSVLIKKEYRKYAYKLLIQLRNDIQSKDKLVAIAVSPEGHRMCEKFMKKVGNVSNNIGVYIKEK